MKGAGFFSWLFGYWELEIDFSDAAEFMNVCKRYGFVYRRFSHDRDRGRASFTCASSTAKQLIAALGARGIAIKVSARHGAPYLIYKYRARAGLFVGLLISVLIFALSQSVLWKIEVVGNERLSEDEVIAELRGGGLFVGCRLGEIATDSVENRVLLASDDISWLSVNMSGTVAHVEIREVIDTEIKEKEARPANLVAARDGQISALEVYSGFLCVKEGDFVRAGDLLVSGIYDGTQGALRYTRASGSVFAKTVRTFTVEIPLWRQIKVYSDGYIEKKTLNFFGKSIKLFINSGNESASCDIINYECKFDPVGLGALPVSVMVERIYPYTYERAEISAARAEELAYYELRALLESEIPYARLLKKTVRGELTEDSFVLSCTVVCIEDIAKISEFEIK